MEDKNPKKDFTIPHIGTYPTMPDTSNQPRKWEESFEEKFPSDYIRIICPGSDYSASYELKTFIRQVEDQTREEERKRFEGILANLATGPNCLNKPQCCGYHDAINDALSTLSKEELTK